VSRATAFTAALVLALAARLAAQEPPKPPAGHTPADTVRADSLRVDSLRADTVQAKSTVARTLPPGVQLGYRRSPALGLDPFRHALIPHWGFVVGATASADNNAGNLSDVGAFMLLGKHDSITASSVIDALGLVPNGQGLQGLAGGDGGVYLGGPFGSRIGLGLTAGGRGYGSFLLDDNAVALLRDGNGARQNFSLGQTHGAGLATAEGGAHLLVRLGAVRDEPGLRVILGAGARYLKPLWYGRSTSAIASGGTLRVTNDSIAANLRISTAQAVDAPNVKGSGTAADFLIRFELPEPGLALEAMLVNVGTVKLERVEHRLATFSVATTSFKTVKDSLDKSKFRVQDTSAATVQLPQQMRFALNAWVLPVIQLDAAYTTAVTGDFAAPAMLEAGATLRLIRWLPLRAGIVHAGDFGTGYTGGIAIESRVVYLQLNGASYGGAFKQARGAGGRVELGFFF
jgi:hypothetical protein